MEDYVRAAVAQGMDEIGFLAHAEAAIVHPKDPRILWLENGDYQAYWEDGKELKAKFADRIRVSLGLELGLNPYALVELEKIILHHPWDRIGLSYHQLTDECGHLNICSRKSISRIREVDNLDFVKRYYRDLKDHISIIKPYMLCHFDVVRKHMHDYSADPEVQRLIRALLLEMKKGAVLLEVNTAGYDTVGAPYPAPWIIREAVTLGIGLVLNSDSHAPEHVGRRFGEAVRYIEDSLQHAP
jgi:histidinol-phosphatase (PHP family)